MKRISVVLGLGVIVFVLGVRGSENRSSADGVNLGRTTLAGCLQQSGAEFADSTADLKFFFKAKHAGAASKFGFTYDKSVKLFVQLWKGNEGRAGWLLWSAQPFEGKRGPAGVVKSGPPGSYVAYMRSPTAHERAAASQCIS